jgi:outer membrane protein assembly factor BamB
MPRYRLGIDIGSSLVMVAIAGKRSWIITAALILMTTVANASARAIPPREPPPDDSLQRHWPMFGGTPFRNMANPLVKNLPADWNVENGKFKNIRWVAGLGSNSFGSPVVAEGRVFVGTNNKKPGNPMRLPPQAVLKVFRESDGALLWQNAHPLPNIPLFGNTPMEGLLSTPTVAEERVYYVTPSCEVICAAVKNGAIYWRCDLIKEFGVVPREANICAPLVLGELVFVTTAHGRNGAGFLPAPQAPSFVALSKQTGKMIWQSSHPGNNVIEGQWSSPTLAMVRGKPQVIFAGGDCVLYSFEPATGNLLWKCDCNPGRNPGVFANYIVSTPVVVGDRLFVGLGVHPEHAQPPQFSYFLCLNVTKQGDVSLRSYKADDRANKDSALVWAFGGPRHVPPPKGRRVFFGTTISTAAVHNGLVYISEEFGYLHCLDAKTGERYWEHDFRDPIWGSPYYGDGKLFLGSEGGTMMIVEPGKKHRVLATIEMEETIYTTPCAANETLYLATKTKLYAIGLPAQKR